MPLLLDPADSQRTDAPTGAAVTFVRIDHLYLVNSPDNGPAGTIQIGVYVDANAAANKTAVRSRTIVLTLNQAQTLVNLVNGRIEQALSAANGPFPNATQV